MTMTWNGGTGTGGAAEGGSDPTVQDASLSQNDSNTQDQFAINDDNCYLASGILSQIYKSFYSRPLDKINIPEIGALTVDFEYNYFTKDERVRSDIPGDMTLVSLDMSNTEEIFKKATSQKSPRLVKISFKKPATGTGNLLNSSNLGNLDPINIMNDILIEGAMSNEIFTGLELIDTGREEKIYSMLRAAQSFIEIRSENDTDKSAAQKLHNVLEEKGGLFGADKKIIIEALATLNTNSFKIPNVNSLESKTAVNDGDPLGKQNFSVQFNNLLMHDLVKSATRIPDNVFQDELRGLIPLSKQIKNDLILNAQPANVFSELDYELQVPAIQVRPVSLNQQANITSQYPEIRFAGYMLEKYELLKNEGVVYLGKKFIQNPDQQYIVDHDIAYGRSYFYKVRTVCEVKTIVNTDNDLDPSLNQVMTATILMASEGKTASVFCKESIAPPPPTGIRVTFDFNKLVPRLSWQFPLNKQRDIKRFQIFKRLSIDVPFTLIAEYDFDNSVIRTPVREIALPENIYLMKIPRLSFVDTSHNEGEKPIYTVACVDAHALSSNYGPQVKVSRDRYTNKVTREIISSPGAPKPYPNLLVNNDAFIDSIKVSEYKKIKLFFDPEYYQAFKYDKQQGDSSNTNFETNLNLLAIDPNKFTYKLQIINVDNQKDQIIKIKLADMSSAGANEVMQPAENFSRNNINFQFGI